MKAKQKKRGVLRAVLFVFISLVLGLGIYAFNAQNLTGNAMPMPFGVGMGVVMSESMEPELYKDDFIVVVKRKHYSVGETVVYQDRRLLVVHEIIRFEGDMVVTKGKANNDEDDPIPMTAIKGEVVLSLKGVGKAVNFIKSPVVTLVILALSFFLLIKSYETEESQADELSEIKKEIERLKAGEEDRENSKE